MFTWKSHAGLKLDFCQNDRYKIHTVLSSFRLNSCEYKKRADWTPKWDFQPRWNLIPVWVHFASHVKVFLESSAKLSKILDWAISYMKLAFFLVSFFAKHYTLIIFHHLNKYPETYLEPRWTTTMELHRLQCYRGYFRKKASS